MPTLVSDLMSAPAVTCPVGTSLGEAARQMNDANIGSVVVTEQGKVTGILTERDLLRATSAQAGPADEPVELWMTANPAVLSPDEEASAAWESLSHHHYRHLPVVSGEALVGVVSIRDLFGIARLRPATETGVEVPKGLEGVVVAETTIGDVRGAEGFYHYRQYSAVDLAAARSFEDVWHLLYFGELPGHEEAGRFRAALGELRAMPQHLGAILGDVAGLGGPLDVLRTCVSIVGAELGWAPTHDIGSDELRAQCLRLCALAPTVLAAAHRVRNGLDPVTPRADLGFAANYLWMLTGEEPTAAQARAVEQYLILTIDHGFNASTFTARVITSTGADLAAAVCGAIGALSGPLHGGAPSRCLDMLDAMGSPERAEPYIREAVARGERIMGFGHRVYKTDDPRSLFLREVARGLGGPLVDLAIHVERTVVDVLAELKPGRQLYANVEFYAGPVMFHSGIARDMFTPTFSISRLVGWTSHVMEQAADNRLIRPTARYVGPPPPQPLPAI